jgi:hypothetical protein
MTVPIGGQTSNFIWDRTRYQMGPKGPSSYDGFVKAIHAYLLPDQHYTIPEQPAMQAAVVPHPAMERAYAMPTLAVAPQYELVPAPPSYVSGNNTICTGVIIHPV